jgi:hypothetical protein
MVQICTSMPRTAEALHEFGIEVGHRHRLEREVFDPASLVSMTSL